MKIGIYDPYLGVLEGGERYMLTLASCLSHEDVHLFWDDPEVLSKGENKFAIDLNNVKVDKNPFGTVKNTLQRISELNKFDLIFFLSDGSLPFIPSKKLIVHFQFPVEWVGNSIKTKIKLTRIKKIICNSKFTKKYIDKKFGVDSLVVYPPVEIKADKSKRKKKTILSVGRIGFTLNGQLYKKQDVMISEFKKMIDEGVEGWRFKLVLGSRVEFGDQVKKLQDTVLGYPIDIIVNPSNQDLWNLYSEAKIYWHATGVGENLDAHPENAEHFGISTVEAMGAGVVPVVINAGGQSEIIENGLDGFLWNTLIEMKEKTLHLMNNTELLNKMSKRAVTKSEKFSKENFCEQIQKLIISR